MTQRAAPNETANGDAPNDVATDSEPARRSARWVVGAIVLVALVAFIASRRSSSDEPTQQADVAGIVNGAIEKAIEDLQSAPPRSVDIYNAIIPSIVVIQTDLPARTTGVGLGTGVIINDQGAILTALHVVDKAKNIKVSFADGTESAAAVEATDEENDIAVLVTELLPDVIVPAVLGGGLQIGEDAYAVGHPLGLVGSLSAGVVSGLDRSITREDGVALKGLIQFDAAVNPGNSGGPLLNRNGQVVGIVTALANPSRDGYFMGVGFAVPIGTAGGAAGAPRQ